jgi:hypothetical protein
VGFREISPKNRSNVQFSATVRVQGQLDYILFRRNDDSRGETMKVSYFETARYLAAIAGGMAGAARGL